MFSREYERRFFKGDPVKQYIKVIPTTVLAVILYSIHFAWADSLPQFDRVTIGAASTYYYDATMDSQNNILMSGYFYGTVDFDYEESVDLHVPIGAFDGFITKFNADGSYGWTRTIGSNSFDIIINISTDAFGNIFYGGFINGIADLDPTSGEDWYGRVSQITGFITKLNPDGSYAWTKAFEAVGGDRHLVRTAIDSNGNIFCVSFFTGTVDFDPGSEIYSVTGNSADIAITKLAPDGTHLWTKIITGPRQQTVSQAIITNNGSVVFTGQFEGSADFDPTDGIDIRTSSSFDYFVTKINSDGSYGWTFNELGGSFMRSVTLDSTENVILAVRNRIIKLNPDGSELWRQNWSSLFEILDVTVDHENNILSTGFFTDTVDFDPSEGHDEHTDLGQYSMFLLKLNSDRSYGWAQSFGGLNSNNGNNQNVHVDSFGNIVMTGEFSGTIDFDPGPEERNYTGDNLFALKLRTNHTPLIIAPVGISGTTGRMLQFEVLVSDEDAGDNVFVSFPTLPAWIRVLSSQTSSNHYVLGGIPRAQGMFQVIIEADDGNEVASHQTVIDIRRSPASKLPNP